MKIIRQSEIWRFTGLDYKPERTKTSPPLARVALISVMQHETSSKHFENFLKLP